MSFNSVSKTETPSVTASPSPSPSPLPSPQQPPLMIFSAANTESQSPISLRRPNPNHRTLSDYGLSVGPGGFRLADSTLNPVPSFSSLSLDPNPTQIKFSPGLGFSNLTHKPVGLVEPSDKKGKAKVTFQLPERKHTPVSGSGFVAANGSDIADTDEGEALAFHAKEEEGEVKKTWNLRPRKEKKVAKSRTPSGGGGRRGVVQESRQPKMPTRPRTPRGANSAQGAAAAAAPSRPVFSLTLTKAEIEEDFLKMTGQLPPKKPQRRPKNVQKKMDGIFPGMFLDKVTPQTYKVPDPPLKG